MDDATVFGNDPLAMATRWVEDGARRLAAHAAALVGKGATDKPTLKGLAAIFEELDRMTARVARLRCAGM